MKERIAVYLLIAALIALTAVSIAQNTVIVRQKQLIRKLMENRGTVNTWRASFSI